MSLRSDVTAMDMFKGVNLKILVKNHYLSSG